MTNKREPKSNKLYQPLFMSCLTNLPTFELVQVSTPITVKVLKNGTVPPISAVTYKYRQLAIPFYPF